MRTFLIVTSLIVILAAALLYAAARSDHEFVATATENVRQATDNLEIRTALVRHLGPDAAHIRVRAQDGAVSLSGEVEQRSTQELAEEVAMSVDGVKMVHNFIDLEADSAAAGPAVLLTNVELEARDALLEAGVKTTLASEIGDAAFHISVEACDGVVSLRGDLPDQERHQIAIRSVEGIPDVARVIDLLEVAA
ncbi:MAG: BON domain-containing protein [Acidobacteria bacterium]|nr:BON domain-containing protein [Acidobacteriota bacterium]